MANIRFRRRNRPGRGGQEGFDSTVSASEQHKTKKKSPNETASLLSSSASNPAIKDNSSSSSSSFWSVLKEHFLIYVLVLIGLPYFCYLGYRWIRLQHPPFSANIMRPAVGLNEPRQVLILGSMSSGTSSIAHQLSSIIGLEIGHEDSDATWKFVRDGTVSWFHGIRYWPTPQDETLRQKHISQLCKVQWMFRAENGLNDNYGFGPTLFGTPQYNCSLWEQAFPSSSYCYRNACEQALHREYACATLSLTQSPNCRPPFQTTILQLREPWKIVSSLTAKYCYKNGDIASQQLPQNLQWLLLALQMTTLQKQHHCVVQLIDYVTTYYHRILEASPNIPRYRIEDFNDKDMSLVCHVMKLAGLAELETTVYPPNHQLYLHHCGDYNDDEDADHNNENRPRNIKSNTFQHKATVNVINKGRVEWEMLLDYVTDDDPAIAKMKQLYDTLGYDYPERSTS